MDNFTTRDCTRQNDLSFPFMREMRVHLSPEGRVAAGGRGGQVVWVLGGGGGGYCR